MQSDIVEIDLRLAEASELLEHQRRIIVFLDQDGHALDTSIRLHFCMLGQFKRIENHRRTLFRQIEA